MKIMLLGIAILFIGIILKNYIAASLIVSIIGLAVTVIGCYIGERK